MIHTVVKCDTGTIYTVTHPDWICEWIVYNSGNIKRSCHLIHDLDPVDLNHREHIEKIIPGLVNRIKNVIIAWIDEGYIEAKKLLLGENKPAFLNYAERILLEINGQG